MVGSKGCKYGEGEVFLHHMTYMWRICECECMWWARAVVGGEGVEGIGRTCVNERYNQM